MELLRDPAWQFIGVVLTLLAIALTVYIFRRQHQRKALSFELISSTSLISVSETVKDSLQVFRNGIPVHGLHLLVVRLVNSGNLPIPSADYESPINFSFSNGDVVLEAEITLKQPDNIKVSLEFNASEVKLNPSLLNPKDLIELKILLSQFNGQVKTDARIIGIKQIKQINKDVPDLDTALSVMMMSGTMAFIAGIILILDIIGAIIAKDISKIIEDKFDIFILGVFSHFLVLLAFYRSERRKMQRRTQGSQNP